MAGDEGVVEASLNALMAECQQKLRPVEFLLVQGQRQVLLDGDIVTPDEVKQRSYEQLERAGVTPGAAILLKSVFPSPGHRWRRVGAALGKVWRVVHVIQHVWMTVAMVNDLRAGWEHLQAELAAADQGHPATRKNQQQRWGPPAQRR